MEFLRYRLNTSSGNCIPLNQFLPKSRNKQHLLNPSVFTMNGINQNRGHAPSVVLTSLANRLNVPVTPFVGETKWSGWNCDFLQCKAMTNPCSGSCSTNWVTLLTKTFTVQISPTSPENTPHRQANISLNPIHTKYKRDLLMQNLLQKPASI